MSIRYSTRLKTLTNLLAKSNVKGINEFLAFAETLAALV